MKRLLLPLLAALAFPTAVNAEGYTSILKKVNDTVKKIERRTQEQCNKEAEIFSQASGMRRESCVDDK